MPKLSLKNLLNTLTLCALTTACQTPIVSNVSAPTVRFNRLNTEAVRPVPQQFMWGVSSAGYQAEGNETNSQWYFWEQAGKTKHRSGRAVDFYNRYEEDILLAKGMGVNAFRLSVEWSRIEPRPGEFDESQIAHYRKVIQTVRKHGMTPLVTLVHFTYPQWLLNDTDNDGLRGWEDPDTIDRYVRYTDRIARALGNDVQFWITFNEPNIWLPIAHLFGRTPPGTRSPIGFLRAGWNVLKAHARAYDQLHKINPSAMVSANIFQFQFNPFAKNPKAYAANPDPMNSRTIEAFADSDWFMDSFSSGEFAYASHVNQLFKASHYSSAMSARNNGTVALLGKIDYVAFDYYYRFNKIEQVINAHDTWRMPLYPEGLYNVLRDYQRRFRKPIVIAENGMGTFKDAPRADGWKRGDHIVQHVYQMQRAMRDGANVIGYYHWSITDNYEWGDFDSRFGLYRIEALTDPTLKRIPTDGVAAYQRVIGGGGVTPALMQQYPGPPRS
jgi:beta-glucosidase